MSVADRSISDNWDPAVIKLQADLLALQQLEAIRWEAHLREQALLSTELERRMNESNHLREQMRELGEKMVLKVEYYAAHAMIEKQTHSNERMIWMATGAVAVLSAVLHFVK